MNNCDVLVLPAPGMASLSDKTGSCGSKGEGDKAAAAWPAIGDRRVLQRSALELAVTASVSHPHIVQVGARECVVCA